ncbi:hypothetical protein GGP80_003251 [Salinibacter ruber]|uniref:hypothetical protein n=1 Tax=Salinibacter ruber TaxID=146919 RepID=UPI00216A4392|nr:hypothetical protein [Salinibacter ruber]MCS3937241.1 hypothetical protein [Salinibacter ruber]
MGTIEDLKNPHPSANRGSPKESALRESSTEDSSTEDASEETSSQNSRGSARDRDANSVRDRKRRITVTPNSYDRLERAAEKLGLSKAGVYNLAFGRLVEQMELDV